jgi:hypothetical protein
MAKRVKEVLPEGTKRCTKCKEVKSIDGFNVCLQRKDGLYPSCKACRKLAKTGFVWAKKEGAEVPEGMKECPECQRVLSVGAFNKDSARKDGLGFRCRACCKKYSEENRERGAERGHLYYLENMDSHKASMAVWREDHKEEISAYHKKLRLENPEKMSVASAASFQRNKDKIYARIKKRIGEDPNFRLASCLRARFSSALRGGYKSGSAVRDLGCCMDKLRVFLESHSKYFLEDLGRNGVQIDHIIPLSQFDLSDRKELLKAVRYTNLQLLWCTDNQKKGDGIPDFAPYYGPLIFKEFPSLYPRDKSVSESLLRFPS